MALSCRLKSTPPTHYIIRKESTRAASGIRDLTFGWRSQRPTSRAVFLAQLIFPGFTVREIRNNLCTVWGERVTFAHGTIWHGSVTHNCVSPNCSALFRWKRDRNYLYPGVIAGHALAKTGQYETKQHVRPTENIQCTVFLQCWEISAIFLQFRHPQVKQKWWL